MIKNAWDQDLSQLLNKLDLDAKQLTRIPEKKMYVFRGFGIKSPSMVGMP